MTRSEELRRSYPAFYYETFSIEKTPSQVTARFKFSIPPDISFTPEVHFHAVPGGWYNIDETFLQNAIFHLGLIEAFSYWKATASPTLEIHAGNLTDEQRQWWHDLLIHGMGEFFYHNDIDFTCRAQG